MSNTKRALTFTQVYDKSYFGYNRACDICAEQDALADMIRYQSMDRNMPLMKMNNLGPVTEHLYIINPDNVEIIMMSLRFVKKDNKAKPEFTTLYHDTMEYNEDYFYILQVINANSLDECKAYDRYDLAMIEARDIVAHHPDSHVAVHKIHKTCGTIGDVWGQYDLDYDYKGKSVDVIYQRIRSRAVSEVTAYDPDHKRWYTVMWDGQYMVWDMSYNKLKANYDDIQACSYAPGDPLRWTLHDSSGWWYYPSDYDLHPDRCTMLEE